MLIDTHAHLTDVLYGGAQNILNSMKADGLEKIITVGYDMESSLGGLDIAQKNKDVFCAIGYHPSELKKYQDGDCAKLLEMSKSDKCAAIGEIGLDYHYDDTDRPLQKDGLQKQLELVEAADLPVIFHIRDADEDMLNIVRSNLGKLKKRGVVHCFSGSKETAKAYIDMGFYISFTGAVTFKNAVKFPEIIKSLPFEKIMVETDCPYLTPVPHRGEVNYPKYVRFSAERIAGILGKDVDEVIERTTLNAYTLFGKMKKDS